ncbi:MAG: GNAT family N-acetyltransferase [bacterium]|nr:GNAT family N-acetyltransferase [bacterium]
MVTQRRQSASGRAGAIRCRALTADDWPVVVELFGANGACGGCWCMYWRLPRGGRLWEEKKGRPNRDAFRRLIKAGRVHAALAFVDDTPVGWCCLGPRGDFPRVERTKALAIEWGERTWAVVCLYIKTGYRGRGVASKLVAEAVRIARSRGARRLEAYPVEPKTKQPIPAAFAWTGVPAIFTSNGFRVMARPGDFSRDIYVRNFRSPR